MNLKKLTENVRLIENDSEKAILCDVQSALDLFVTAKYDCNCSKLVIMKQDICEEFFDLSTKIAGEILQKFVTYGFALAIVGDFSGYTSKALKDFIYESNKGKIVFFVDSVDTAVQYLERG